MASSLLRIVNAAPLLGYPAIGRSGLGNILFPWARCVLWCRAQQVPMVAPFWFRFRIGPYLRRERDKRAYHRLFTSGGYVAGLGRLAALATMPRLAEPISRFSRPSEPGLACFTGMGSLFVPLRGEASILGDELARITRPWLRPAPRGDAFLAIHVRRGDFSTPASAAVLTAGHESYRIEIDWYVEALRALRAALGWTAPAVVFSDGTDAELAHLFAEPSVLRSTGRKAITDLLEMSGAAALIASGSTFSMWASFLGQIPTLWFPGQRRQHVLGIEDSEALEPLWASGPLPAPLTREVSSRFVRLRSLGR